MDKKKTDLILIVITVILVGVLIGGFIYDRNSALLARTNYFPITEDQNLEVVKIDVENNLIALKGAVPGPKGGIVCIVDSVKA